jgi:hypothetical protein
MRDGTQRLFIILWGALAACNTDPIPGGDCTTSKDCVSTEICLGGQCTPMETRPTGCTSDLDCPFGSACEASTGDCIPRTNGDDAGPIPPDGSSNVPDGNTNPGPDGGPTPDAGGNACTTDQECGAPSQICINNQCVDGCGTNAALCDPNTEICDPSTGRCVQVSCGDDTDCSPPMTICESMQCIPGCHLTGGLQCSGATPACNSSTGRCEGATPCNLDSDCGDPDKICIAQICATKCNLPGGIACVSPEVCNAQTGRCVAGGASLGQACSLDAQCAPDFCVGLTDSMMMTTRFCSRTCGAGSDCPLGFRCSYVSGMKICLPGSYFTPPASFNIAAGGMCNLTNIECQSGWYQSNATTMSCTCLETCSRNNDCAQFGGNCSTVSVPMSTPTRYDHICDTQTPGSGASCVVNADCTSGICNRYTTSCANACCRDSDCPGNEICTVYDFDVATAYIIKACRAPQTAMAGSGSAALGATCSVASDCSTGACTPVDPNMPTGARKCSTTCCTDADCSVLPLGGKCRPLSGPTINNIPTLVGYCIPN